jgi:16S rRNA (cytidine1402-2'-O)-methyltransferase
VKSGGRERDLLGAAARPETTIFLESPHRLLKTLEVCATHFPERDLCVAREMTKQFEEFRRGRAPELLAHYSARAVRGEIVFLIRGADS